MNRFSQFNITLANTGFEGDKIRIIKILNKEIVVHYFKIEPSKIKAFQEKGTGKCMYLQISINNEKHVLFTGSGYLIEAIEQIPLSGFPFTSTIIQENEGYKFT
jgi:hypothetical protein